MLVAPRNSCIACSRTPCNSLVSLLVFIFVRLPNPSAQHTQGGLMGCAFRQAIIIPGNFIYTAISIVGARRAYLALAIWPSLALLMVPPQHPQYTQTPCLRCMLRDVKLMRRSHDTNSRSKAQLTTLPERSPARRLYLSRCSNQRRRFCTDVSKLDFVVFDVRSSA